MIRLFWLGNFRRTILRWCKTYVVQKITRRPERRYRLFERFVSLLPSLDFRSFLDFPFTPCFRLWFGVRVMFHVFSWSPEGDIWYWGLPPSWSGDPVPSSFTVGEDLMYWSWILGFWGSLVRVTQVLVSGGGLSFSYSVVYLFFRFYYLLFKCEGSETIILIIYVLSRKIYVLVRMVHNISFINFFRFYSSIYIPSLGLWYFILVRLNFFSVHFVNIYFLYQQL